MIAVANICSSSSRPSTASSKALAVFGRHAQLARQQGTALACLMVITVWKEAGFFMIFYLAALQSMSPHLAEAQRSRAHRAGISSGA
jgi:sn-glycerol 3-phosphate transport system permease protein